MHVKNNINLLQSIFVFFFQVDLDPNSGIFITLNPAGKGYGGRQKLPDNLKQLFRPVAMSRPDNELIAEVILFSEGFKSAKIIGRKLIAIFSLSRYVFNNCLLVGVINRIIVVIVVVVLIESCYLLNNITIGD